MNSPADAVTLKSGLTVPVGTLQRLWAMEDRGIRFEVVADALRAGPSALLNDDDRRFLREAKAEVVAVVRYCDEVVSA